MNVETMDARDDNWSQTEPHDATTWENRSTRRRENRSTSRRHETTTKTQIIDDDRGGRVGWENSLEFTQSTNQSL